MKRTRWWQRLIMWFERNERRAANHASSQTTNYYDVLLFHQKFQLLYFVSPGHLTQRKLEERIAFMQEELDEFITAAHAQDLIGQADALLDLVYVALGTAGMLGLPWEPLWKIVHEANMKKERRASLTGDHHDVTKPLGWIAPEPALRHILESYGYHQDDWCEGPDERVPDRLCRDDPHHMVALNAQRAARFKNELTRGLLSTEPTLDDRGK